jgi:hypothetical protein
LKKSGFLRTAKISGIEHVYPRRERRLQGFLTQSFSEHFSGSEFFNNHKEISLKTAPVGEKKISEWNRPVSNQNPESLDPPCVPMPLLRLSLVPFSG